MRYAIIKYNQSNEYDLVDYKRNRISSICFLNLNNLVSHYYNNSAPWFTPDNQDIITYLERHLSFTTIYTCESIKELQTTYPEYFI